MDNCQKHAGHEARMDMTDEAIKDVQCNIREIVKGQHEIRERVVAIDQSSKSAHHRLDSQAEQTKAIARMGMAVEHMAEQVKEAVELLKDHDMRLDKLERAPGDLLIGWSKLAIGALITGAIGMLIGTLLR